VVQLAGGPSFEILKVVVLFGFGVAVELPPQYSSRSNLKFVA
jgi:hypothetical protein